ncbi:hypothetical protein MA16_Dca026763 [Dendrobium catenatum]|uniref:Uncharacterized protein n=1 Tax=Dendrobium catenatum TaxID=906689 RepID=A0A2I0VJD1_9ASPA|nr:hypothetical protein MA16_Dca026763 [Dendrobium catenatum]
MASARRRAKCVDSIKQVDGTVVTVQRDISNVIFNFFEQKWKGQDIVEDGWPSHESQRSYMVGFVGALDGEVTKDEIWYVVSSLGHNKAPGRDGVTASFFKFYWDIVG